MIDYVVKFRILKNACCGTPPYWVAKQVTISSSSAEEAKARVIKLWSIANQIEIDEVKQKQ